MTYSDYQPQILVIDDELEIREFIRDALAFENMQCTVAQDCKQVEHLLQKQDFDIVISDICMPDMTGLDLLQRVNNFSPATKTILMTGHRRSDWAQTALREGAFDYLEKPFDLKAFYKSVNHALQERRALNHKVDPTRLVDRYCYLILNEQGNIQFVSGQFASITGLNPGGIVDVSFESLFAQTTNTIENVFKLTSSGQKITLSLKRRSGESFDAEVTINQVAIGNATPFYYVRMIDLSNVKMAGQSLRRINRMKHHHI